MRTNLVTKTFARQQLQRWRRREMWGFVWQRNVLRLYSLLCGLL